MTLESLLEKTKNTSNWRTRGQIKNMLTLGSAFLALTYLTISCGKKPIDPDPVNHAPNINSYQPTDLSPSLQEGQSLEFNFLATDSDADPLTYKMLKDGSIVVNDNEFTFNDTQGSYVIKGIVSDPAGLADTIQWNLSVLEKPNNVPVITQTTPSKDTTVYVNDTIPLNLTATDADSDPVTTWTNPSNYFTSNSTGSFPVTFYATDDKDTTSTSINITVQDTPNHTPYLTNITPSDTSLFLGDSVWVSALAHDADAGDTPQALYVQGTDTLDAPFWLKPLVEGQEIISYLATDGKVTVNEGTRTITTSHIPNVPPTAIAEVNPDKGNLPLTVYLNSSNSSDTDGIIDSVLWNVEGTEYKTDQNIILSELGQKLIELTVYDNSGASAKDTTFVTVEDTENPVALYNIDITTGRAPLTINASDNSTDNHGIATRDWKLDGSNIGAGETLNYTFNDPGQYALWLIVGDQSGNVDSTKKDITVTQNQAPVITSLENILTGEVPTIRNLNATAIDNDGSIVDEEWDINGTKLANHSQYTFTNPGEYDITFTATDNEGAMVDSTISVSFMDTTAPISRFILNSDSADAPYTFIATNNSTDNHAVDSVNWFLDGSNVGNQNTFNREISVAGDYVLSMTAWDPSGNYSSTDTTLKVTAPITTISGQIVNGILQPLEGTVIEVYDSTSQKLFSATSDGSGNYSVDIDATGSGHMKVYHNDLSTHIMAPFSWNSDQTMNHWMFPDSIHIQSSLLDTTVATNLDWYRDFSPQSPTRPDGRWIWHPDSLPVDIFYSGWQPADTVLFNKALDSLTALYGMQLARQTNDAQNWDVLLQQGSTNEWTPLTQANEQLIRGNITLLNSLTWKDIFIHELTHSFGLDGSHINSEYDEGNPSNFYASVPTITTPQDFTNIYISILKEMAKKEGLKSASLLQYNNN